MWNIERKGERMQYGHPNFKLQEYTYSALPKALQTAKSANMARVLNQKPTFKSDSVAFHRLNRQVWNHSLASLEHGSHTDFFPFDRNLELI
jgi:hypothetical protein